MFPLSSIAIRNFKSIKEVDVQFGRLNIIIGENGAGKSNLLEAIGVLSTALSGNIDYARLAERGVRRSAPEVFKSSFKHFDRPKEIQLKSVLMESISYDVTLLPEQGKHRQSFHYKSESLKADEARIAGRSYNGARINNKPVKKPLSNVSILLATYSQGVLADNCSNILNTVSRYAIYAPSTPILRGVSIDDSRQDHLGLYGGSLAQAFASLDKSSRKEILQVLKQMFRWIRSIGSVVPESTLQANSVHTMNRVVAFKDEYMKVNFNTLYAYDISEGALYALFVLCLLYHQSSPDVFALDNVDSTLNPGLVTSLIESMALALENFDTKQVFLTTHNPTTLDAIDLFNPLHRLFVVERDENGSSIVRRISPPRSMSKEKWSVLVNNMKLSELWLSGALGALYKG